MILEDAGEKFRMLKAKIPVRILPPSSFKKPEPFRFRAFLLYNKFMFCLFV